MKAREKGTNEKFQKIYTIILEDGIQYHPDSIEFENEDTTNWEEVRIKAAIAAMQGILSNDIIYRKVLGIASNRNMEVGIGVANVAVSYADALIKELKENSYEQDSNRFRTK